MDSTAVLFSIGTVGTLGKTYRYRSADTFISQFFGGTRYSFKFSYNKKIIIKKAEVGIF